VNIQLFIMIVSKKLELHSCLSCKWSYTITTRKSFKKLI